MQVLDGGKTSIERNGSADGEPRAGRPLDPAKELIEAFAVAPIVDYDELRADLDAIADPSPRDWYAWQARTDRHLRRGALK